MDDATRWTTAPPVRVPIPTGAVVRGQSHGEVTNYETLDFRTLKPVTGGLFCERIFGPMPELKCACGRSTGRDIMGQVCPHCGSRVIWIEDRCHQMGHIELASPVCHPEYLRGEGEPVARWCGVEQPVLEGLVYHTHQIVLALDPEEARRQWPAVLAAVRKSSPADVPSPQIVEELLDRLEMLSAGDVLTADEADPLRRIRKACASHEPGAFERFLDLRTGAEAVRCLLERAGSPDGGAAVLDCLPVIPPAVREIRILDERRMATHEVNDLYRRVLNRSFRLRKLFELGAPDTILDLEGRRLQESVDALIDNARSPEPVLNARGVPMKSLADL